MAFTYTGQKVDLGFGRGWLDVPAAASVRRIDRHIGHPMQITEAGRDWARQNEHYQHYLKYGSPIALSPNAPSIHQKGGAVDSDEAQRIVSILEEHGWRRTVYRWVNGRWTLVEPWHFEYFAHLDKHINDPAPSGGAGTAPKENDMSILFNANGNIYTLSPGQIKLETDPLFVGKAIAAGEVQVNGTGTVAQQNEQFVKWLDHFGIPRSIDGKGMLDNNGWVLNPETGKHEYGGMWSWDRYNTVMLRKLLAK